MSISKGQKTTHFNIVGLKFIHESTDEIRYYTLSPKSIIRSLLLYLSILTDIAQEEVDYVKKGIYNGNFSDIMLNSKYGACFSADSCRQQAKGCEESFSGPAGMGEKSRKLGKTCPAANLRLAPGTISQPDI